VIINTQQSPWDYCRCEGNNTTEGNELSLDDKLGFEQACLHGRHKSHNDMKSHATMITLTGRKTVD